MALHTTRWSPDTCGCIIDLEWDDAQDENARIHSLAAIPARCPAHSALAPPVVFNTVMEENRRKNQVLAIAQGVLPDITPGGYEWSFDAQRRLRVRFSGVTLTPAQRAQIQAAIDVALGPDRAGLV